MRRLSLLFGAGLVLALIALSFMPTADLAIAPSLVAVESEAAPTAAGASMPRAIDFLELVTGSIDATELAALERLAAEADAATLASVTAQVAALPSFASRAVALEVLLARYREIDELGYARVLDAAHIDADQLRLEAAVARAATEPESAIEDALLLPERESAAALARIAVAWSQKDVHGALAYFARLGDERMRHDLTIAALSEWASTDAEAMLAYARDLAPDQRDDALPGALQALALLEPARALETADSFSGELGAMLRRAALMSVARDDAPAALGYAAALPPGAEREQLLGAVAHAYGRADPAAAIAWARTAESPAALASVVSGVARVDPERALELAFTLPGMQEQQRLLLSLVSSGALGAAHMASLADRLLAQPSRSSGLQLLTRVWAQRAPEDALRWVLANRARASTSVLAQAGVSLARTNPAAAIAYLEHLPSELRADWIGAVAEGYAQNDARAAASWVMQHRGEPGYDAAVTAVAARTAPQDPAVAARLFASVDVSHAPDAAASARAIAASWARQDAPSAARWAHELDDADVAAAAVAAAARGWVARDATAASAWALGLPPDARRDAALVQILGATAGRPSADPAVLEAFSSAAAQQAGVNDAVRIVAARDAEAARRLADRYLVDPGLRRSAERFVDLE